MDIATNYTRIRAAIDNAAAKAGRNPSDITLVAVTKTVGLEAINTAAVQGIKDFGENRVQDAIPKISHYRNLRWHFVGHLQTNKVKKILPLCTFIHSLDRLSLAEAINKEAKKAANKANVLIQVNLSGEKSKYGLKISELGDFINGIEKFSYLNVHGLMTMAPLVDNPEETRPVFRKMRELRNEYRRTGMELKELSMGMTNDYLVAVEEGATMVRIGTALFS